MTRHPTLFEFHRQLAHVLFGVVILWGMHFHIFTASSLAILTVIAAIALYLVKKGVHVFLLWDLLHFFERPDHFEKFPGRGMFFFLLGATATNYLYDPHIAMAALSILLVGDAMTNIVGSHAGNITNPLNKDKTVEGTVAGIISSWMVCVLFFPAIPSLAASVAAMIVEIPKVHIGKIPVDDNVTIPIIAGAVLSLF